MSRKLCRLSDSELCILVNFENGEIKYQDLLASPNVEVKEVEKRVSRYKKAFHNFVCSHDNYLLYQDDEEKKESLPDSCNNQKEIKLQLGILVNNWRAIKKRMNRPPI